jgi:maleate cis-trans isomerase
VYGHRARIGVLVPSGIITIEPEFNMVVPEGVTCHYHRFRFMGGGETKAVLDDLKAAVDYIADASELITHVHPSVVVMAGTGVSFIGGYGYDQMLIQKMKERNSNLPTTTTSTAVIAAFQSLGVKKVSVAMPYIEDVARAAVKFVEDNGTEVVNARWLNKSGFDISLIPEDELYKLAVETDTPESDALFISCTSLHTFRLIEKLEKDLKKPVITSNQATIWHALRLAGIEDKINGYGRLLAEK